MILRYLTAMNIKTRCFLLTSHLAPRTLDLALYFYSVLILLTGLAKADLTDCILIVKNAINIERPAAAAKTHTLISVL